MFSRNLETHGTLKPEITMEVLKTVYLYKWWVGRQRINPSFFEALILIWTAFGKWDVAQTLSNHCLDDLGKWEISSNTEFFTECPLTKRLLDTK